MEVSGKLYRATKAYLLDLGATDVSLEHGGKHAKILFCWNGRSLFVVMSGSPSDNARGEMNLRKDIRKTIGVQGNNHRRAMAA